MADPYFSDLLGDPLSDITRKERRNLLFASTLGCAIVSMDMVPTKLSALGIDFSSPAQSSFLILVAVVIGYFLVAFLTCGISDFFIWRRKYQEHLIAREMESQNISLDDQIEYEENCRGLPRADWLYHWHSSAATMRLSFEFLVPVIAGIVAAGMLLYKLLRA